MSLVFTLIVFAFPRHKMIFSTVNQFIQKLLFSFKLENSSSRLTCASREFGKKICSDHLTLSGGNEKSRVIIIGDIHGCLDELEELLKKCGIDETTDTLIFVGDLVNKGPKSAETIKFVRELTERGVAYCVMGNHDLATLRVYDGPRDGWKQKYNYLNVLTK
jgi:hypothetical protein